jgi:HlyD family secretion protein
MKRPLVVVIAIVAVLAGLLVWRVRAQGARSHAASGGSATVEGIETIVGAQIPGRVTEVLVREGDRVTHGQTLARIDCAQTQAALALAEARVLAAQAQVDVLEAQVGSATDAVAVARAQAVATRAQAEVLAVQQQQSARDRARAASLVSAGAAPPVELEKTDERLRAIEEQIKVHSATTTAAVLGSRASAANVEVVKSNIAVVRAQVQASQADLDRAKIAVTECTIVAPSDGVVTSRLVEPGMVVAPGSRLVVTVAVDPARVTFFLPDAELARARLGAPATVHVDAYPDRVFKGVVRRVAQEAEFTPRNVQTREDRDRLVYAVEIEVPNADGALRAGMPADVSLDGTER